jgi:hypothetical protein
MEPSGGDVGGCADKTIAGNCFQDNVGRIRELPGELQGGQGAH